MCSSIAAVALGVGLVLRGPGLAFGEGFLDLYAGWAQTQATRVTASEHCFLFFCAHETRATRRVDFDGSETFGLRGGYWHEDRPWLGVALDLSFFEAEQSDVRVTVVPLSLLVMLRLSLLPTGEVPKGRLQPYVGFGPSLVYEHASVDFRPDLTEKVTADGVGLGVDTRVGLAWQFRRNLALFGEYRFTHVPISTLVSDRTPGTGLYGTLNTHHFLTGVSLRF